MVIYRAMCEIEYKRTMSNGYNLDFIKSRVQDGCFNNSKHKPDRYARLLAFKIDDLDKSDFVSDNEIQFDRRKNPKIILIGEIL